MNNLKIEEILQSFYEISGMDVAIVNTRNKIIARRYSGAQYCAAIHKSPKCLEKCVESDRCGLCAAHEKGDLYVYKCPFGIYEALMPIYSNDETVAYLFVGMGIEDREESLSELMEAALDISPNLNKKVLEKSISDVPRYSKAKLDAFASMLPLIAQYIEANNLLSDTDMTVGQLVKTYVKNNLSKKITLSELSWKLHCSTVTLTEHFKREYGITIMEYVTQKRMDKAVRLLENSDLSIREISEECGFPDIEYFSRCFKSTHNMSPTTWRKKYSNIIISPMKRLKIEAFEVDDDIHAENDGVYDDFSDDEIVLEEEIAPVPEKDENEVPKAEEENGKSETELDENEKINRMILKYGSCFD